MALRDLQRDIDCVVLGASAGGVEALQRIAAALPAGFAPPLLVVLHLLADRPSGMVALLAEHCALRVVEAEDKAPIVAGQIVIAPPDYHLLVERGRTLALSLDAPVLHSRPAIDPLFESAALAFGERLLALLLTGARSDGSAGVAAVRRRGGTAWVQDPQDARVATMPAAALQRAGADAVLTLDQICARFAGATTP